MEKQPILTSEKELPVSQESQDELAQKYLERYAEYTEILNECGRQMRILDKLVDEASMPEMIAEQKEKLAISLEAEKAAQQKYLEIGKKLTEETKEKYLKI